MNLNERVTAGAEWLDENEPGWEERIDLASFAIDDSCRCVFAQVLPEGNYSKSMDRLGLSHEWAYEHGFSAKNSAEWDALDTAWITLVKERFDTGNLSGAS